VWGVVSLSPTPTSPAWVAVALRAHEPTADQAERRLRRNSQGGWEAFCGAASAGFGHSNFVSYWEAGKAPCSFGW
jgi:hypothetical protein